MVFLKWESVPEKFYISEKKLPLFERQLLMQLGL